MFNKGDKVIVTNSGKTYTTYPIEKLTNDLEIIKRYQYGRSELVEKDVEYEVVACVDGRAFITRDTCSKSFFRIEREEDGGIYLIGEEGLALAQEAETVEMTLKEIKEKLGIGSLKIVSD